ncbi:unnamed protein product [Cladocopium goreaui]|uniref:Uncharacterized protein n=1 Tax=Cladocopium goreaui TaxID=2562237 RepID=A0A9P1GSJ5_9DINO|nr:unnamed protein product [Cladocopium goreaui]
MADLVRGFVERSSTVFLRRGGKTSVSSAEDVLGLLAPHAMKGTDLKKRLQQEQVMTALDLAELDKEDLRDLGLGMVERRRVLRWAMSAEPNNFLESLRTSDEMFGAEGRPIHALEKAQSDLDLWFSLANTTYFPVLMRQLRESLSGSENLAADSEIRESNMRARSIRENMLEEHFDLTPERVKEIFQHVSNGQPILTAQQLVEGLGHIGVTCTDLVPLSSAFALVTHRGGCHAGIRADELDVILSRIKLAQLLGRGEGSVSWSVPPGRLTLVDYTMHNAVIQDLQAEKLLQFFFGHRSHNDGSFGKAAQCSAGCICAAATCPTKVDLHGINIFITLDQLHVKNASSCRLGSAPVQIGSSHVTLILSAPHRPDTLVSVVQPARNASKDWPVSEFCRVDSQEADDAWVEILRQRLKRTRSRLSEHDVRYVGLQIVQLCVDNLVSVVRAFGARLGHLDQVLQPDRGPELDDSTPDASWLSEVSAIRLQLAVVARRLRNARNMLRRLESMVPDDASMGRRLTGYLQDVSDDVDGALEDASHLIERCNALSSAYDAALSREHAAQRRVAKEAERIEQVKQNRHAQKLNDILFVLTTATALFAPVQFLAGVYGMNFAIDGDPTIPELKLEYGYLYFWAIVIIYIFGSGTLAVRLFRKLRIQQEAAHLLRNRQNTFSTLAGESPRVLEGGSPHDEGISSPYQRLTG